MVGGELVGFTDFGVQDGVGCIRYLWYEPGFRAAGEALLDAAEASLHRGGSRRISAFAPSILPFHKNLSDRSGHLRALFTMRGYAVSSGEVYLTWRDFGASLPQLAALASETGGSAAATAAVTLEVEEFVPDTAGDGLTATVLPSTETWAVAADGAKLGICRTIAANEYDGAKELETTCFVSWLGVPVKSTNLSQEGYDARDSSQGKGLGKRLLAASLVAMHQRGFLL